jgi:hypothetical protein
METEIKKSKGREERVRHWSDNDVKEMHKERGFAWRSVHTHLESLKPTSEKYRVNYQDIFGHK